MDPEYVDVNGKPPSKKNMAAGTAPQNGVLVDFMTTACPKGTAEVKHRSLHAG